MVRHFVARQSRRARHRLRRVEQIGGGIAVGDDEVAFRRERGEARAGLDRELIERQMAGAERQRARQFAFPGGKRLAGPRIDQVERSEEHTSELQSLMRISYAVSCLKKKKTTPIAVKDDI